MRYTISLVGRSIIDTISPILPHLATELYLHHPILKHQPDMALKRSFSDIWDDFAKAETKFSLTREELDELMNLVFKIRAELTTKTDKDMPKRVRPTSG